MKVFGIQDYEIKKNIEHDIDYEQLTKARNRGAKYIDFVCLINDLDFGLILINAFIVSWVLSKLNINYFEFILIISILLTYIMIKIIYIFIGKKITKLVNDNKALDREQRTFGIYNRMFYDEGFVQKDKIVNANGKYSKEVEDVIEDKVKYIVIEKLHEKHFIMTPVFIDEDKDKYIVIEKLHEDDDIKHFIMTSVLIDEDKDLEKDLELNNETRIYNKDEIKHVICCLTEYSYIRFVHYLLGNGYITGKGKKSIIYYISLLFNNLILEMLFYSFIMLIMLYIINI